MSAFGGKAKYERRGISPAVCWRYHRSRPRHCDETSRLSGAGEGARTGSAKVRGSFCGNDVRQVAALALYGLVHTDAA